MAVQMSAIIGVLLGNVMWTQLDPKAPNQCQSFFDLNNDTIGVEARDYSPFYYFIMAMSLVNTTVFIFFVKPKMRRSTEDTMKQISE